MSAPCAGPRATGPARTQGPGCVRLRTATWPSTIRAGSAGDGRLREYYRQAEEELHVRPLDEPEAPPPVLVAGLDQVRQAAERLREPLRGTFLLWLEERLTYKEISRRQRIPSNTVATRLLRARRQVRRFTACAWNAPRRACRRGRVRCGGSQRAALGDCCCNSRVITVPARAPDPTDTVIALELAGDPVVDGARLLSTTAGADTLRAFDAQLVGDLAFGVGKTRDAWVHKWTRPDRQVRWPVSPPRPATSLTSSLPPRRLSSATCGSRRPPLPPPSAPSRRAAPVSEADLARASRCLRVGRRASPITDVV